MPAKAMDKRSMVPLPLFMLPSISSTIEASKDKTNEEAERK
jgi:hypothetical protein